jgi:hypothetical protein
MFLPEAKEVIGGIIAAFGLLAIILDFIIDQFKPTPERDVRQRRFIINSIWFIGGLIIMYG